MRRQSATRRVLRRALLLVAAATAPLAWLSAVPASGAQATTVTIQDRAEGWYASAPVGLCSSPLGCPPSQAPTSPYPADTLHVGVAGGQETARTYLVPDLSSLPLGATPQSGVMTLPVATQTGDGTVAESSAKLLACLAKAPVLDGTAGSSATPPAIDCGTAEGLVFNAAKETFTLDLTPFLAAWAHGAAEDGIVVMPSRTSQPTDVWHVAFNGHKRAGTAHVASSVSLSDEGSSLPAPVPSAPAPAAPAPAPIAMPAAPAQGVVPAAPPVVAGNPQPAPQAYQQVSFSRPFQYPMAFLLPIALLAGAVFFGRLFTRDATPVRAR